MRYHINAKGDAALCRARQGRCPFGAASEHFPTLVEAQQAYEERQERAITTYAHRLTLAPSVEKLLEALELKGATPYVVGGAVRDALVSGASPKDVDIELYGVDTMDELQALLTQASYRVDAVGKSFGVLKVALPGGLDIDLSLPRRDNLTGSGHRGFTVDVDASLSLEEASGRRDFTINALYYSHSRGEVLDPHGGVKHWREKRLQHINEHFGEDPLRVLRGVQFASRFELELSANTAALSRSMVSEYSTLPAERVQEEFSKFYGKAKSYTAGLRALRKSGWDVPLGLGEMTPALVGRRLQEVAERASSQEVDKEMLVASSLSQELPEEERRGFLERTLRGVKRQESAQRLTLVAPPQDSSPKELKRWSRALKRERLTAEEFFIARGSESDYSAEAKLAQELGLLRAAPADLVTGKLILQETSRKPGPWMGELQRRASIAQDEELFTTVEEAQVWLKGQLQ